MTETTVAACSECLNPLTLEVRERWDDGTPRVTAYICPTCKADRGFHIDGGTVEDAQ